LHGYINPYPKYFGTTSPPTSPALPEYLIAGLAGDALRIEIYGVLARPKKSLNPLPVGRLKGWPPSTLSATITFGN
jgi:hypothetical protein